MLLFYISLALNLEVAQQTRMRKNEYRAKWMNNEYSEKNERNNELVGSNYSASTPEHMPQNISYIKQTNLDDRFAHKKLSNMWKVSDTNPTTISPVTM